jgi:glyoxylase-like metal-dependent hydrolase (beta-lactamase superfamily II)
LILRKLVVGQIASNCYIVGSEKTSHGMIIDPGADAKEILRTVAKLGLKIKLIVLTHRHPDHVGAGQGSHGRRGGRPRRDGQILAAVAQLHL